MKAEVIKLKCITNMHVGNGEVNYSIVDNEVERDAITNYPIINASGVKGALREYCTVESGDKALVNRIFGSDGQGNSTPGQLRILAAEMLAIPARASEGNSAFYLVSTGTAWERFLNCMELFEKTTNVQKEPTPVKSGLAVEGIPLRESVKLGETEIYLLSEDEFRSISLPVIARNKLDNGISKNLWYEEVVPHESIFYFPVLGEDEKLLNQFTGLICGAAKVLQFGGNASVGYGLCTADILGRE